MFGRGVGRHQDESDCGVLWRVWLQSRSTRVIGTLPSIRGAFTSAPPCIQGEDTILVHEHETMKHRVVHFLQKYLFNPPIKFLFALGLVPPGYGLLETTGRKTGKPRRTPVGNGLVGRQFWIVAEHGQKAGYVRNIVGNPRVRLKLRHGLRARWHTGTAHLLFDDDPRER